MGRAGNGASFLIVQLARCANKSSFLRVSTKRDANAECTIEVRFFAPPPDLAACFTSFYRVEVSLPAGASVSDYLQPEWANLRFFSRNPPRAQVVGGAPLQASRSIATGPSSRPTHFTARATRFWGIGLLPLGWVRFVGVAACDHVNTLIQGASHPVFSRFTPLGELLSRPGASDEAQFERAPEFFRTLAPPPPDERRILAVHEAMIDPYLLEVTEFAERAGMSIRTLERICAKHFGFAPRLLLRRQRLMRTLAAFMLAEAGTGRRRPIGTTTIRRISCMSSAAS